jgi:hypothetical protein
MLNAPDSNSLSPFLIFIGFLFVLMIGSVVSVVGVGVADVAGCVLFLLLLLS